MLRFFPIRRKKVCNGRNQHEPRIRLGDKFSRFKTLSRILSSDSDQQAVTDESIRDTLLDLANYSIMTVLEIDDAQHEQEIAEQKTCDEGASNAD